MNILRDYQLEAVDATMREWESADSTLMVMPTGTGKTQTFCEIVKRRLPERALIIAHREELIYQAVRRLEGFGIEASIEMADVKASTSLFGRSDAVVATVQTLYSGKNGGRMSRFMPDDFGTLILDEAHHYVSPSYRKVIDYFRQNPRLKVLGVTATPDRADEAALGQVFQTVAYDLEILDAIHQGWLVPIEQQLVKIDSLDYSGIRTTAGDLNGADLAQVMEAEKNLQGIASASIDIIGDRRTIVFASSVRHAEMLAEIFCRHRPGMAEWLCGRTDKLDRRAILGRFSNGTTQVVVNVGVLTEGFDNPAVECIVMGRPTKSRCLYSQCVGRATRPLPGVVDGHEKDTPEQRKAAIAASPKTSCLVLDFVGNSGRHKLMTSADILGGKYDDEILERAVKRAEKTGQPMRMDELLDEEVEKLKQERELKRRVEALRKARLVAKASYLMTKIDPFDAYDITPTRSRGWDIGRTLSEKQRGILLKIGIDPDKIGYAEGKAILNEQFRRWNKGLCTVKQAALLKKHGVDTRELPMKQASQMIDQLAKNNWNRPAEWDTQTTVTA